MTCSCEKADMPSLLSPYTAQRLPFSLPSPTILLPQYHIEKSIRQNSLALTNLLRSLSSLRLPSNIRSANTPAPQHQSESRISLKSICLWNDSPRAQSALQALDVCQFCLSRFDSSYTTTNINKITNNTMIAAKVSRPAIAPFLHAE